MRYRKRTRAVLLGLIAGALGWQLLAQLLGRPVDLAALIALAAGGTGEAEPAAPEQEGRMPDPALAPDLPDLGPAPELQNEVWLNTEAPLRLADLRGQVVALEMWTFG